MRAIVIALIGCLLGATAAVSAEPANFAGDWAGAMEVGGGHKLRFILHLVNTNGVWSGTADSPDQGSSGIPISKVTVEGAKLSFEIAKVDGEYEGKLDKDGKTILGTWWQSGAALTLDLTRDDTIPPAPKTPVAQSPGDVRFAGDWAGALDVGGGQKIRFILHLVNTHGAWSGTSDSPDQGGSPIPISAVSIDDKKLSFKIPEVNGSYEGTLDQEGKTITGTWSQNGMALTLNFIRGDASTIKGPNRPQEPKPPFPYDTEDVTYSNSRAHIKLAGTLTRPRGTGPFPVVLLITGSGAQDRDETVMSHKPFLVLSDYLTRQGLAVLRVDDRGVGKSAGNFSASHSGDFAGDVLAGVEYLKTRKDIDPMRIGLAGHSEGGIIAPIVAGESKDIAFIVLLAGVGVPAEDLLVRQASLIMKANGATDDIVKANEDAQRQMFAIVRAEKDPEVAEPKLREVGNALVKKLAAIDPAVAEEGKAGIEGSVQMVNSPWFRYWLTFDPAATLKRVQVPVLALNGSLDLQVDAKQNLPAIEKALREGGNKDVTVEELPGLNHLFQTATTGSPTEYATIEETMSPVAMKKISDWILARTSAKKK